MSSPFELFIALRFLRFHRGRAFLSVISVISVAGVAVGTASLVIALALMAGFVADVRARIHSGSAHLTVLGAGPEELFDAAETLVERLESEPGVHVASPVLFVPALVSHEPLESYGFSELYGVEPRTHSRVVLGDEPETDPFAALDQPTSGGRAGILLGEGLAAKLGAFRGDPVRVFVPRVTLTPWGGQPRTRVYEVVGTYASDHFHEDAVRAYVRLDQARSQLRAESGSSWVEVRTNDLRELAEVKKRLREALSPEWIVVDLIEQNRDLLRALRTEKLILFLAIGLIVVVAALNIVSTLILIVTDKVKQIGTLSALGARPVGIARIFMLQGTIIGITGTLLGLVVGVAACWALDRWELVPLDPDVYYLDHIPFEIQPLDLVFVGALTLGVSFVATLYPALKAARLDPVEAIRHE